MKASSPFDSASERHVRPASRGRRRSSRAFTLVELLAVVSIIGILLAVAIPGIRGLTRGSNMSSALTTLRSTIAMARQYAITQRTTVHVVFPHRTTIAAAQIPDRSKALRAYAVCAVKPGTTDTEYISDWRFLPSGVLFAPDVASSPLFTGLVNNNKSVFSIVAGYDTRTSVRFPDSNSSTVNINCLTFNPDGSLKRDNTETEIYLNDGSLIVTSAGAIGAPLYTSINLWSIVVNPFTGQPGRAKDYSNFIK